MKNKALQFIEQVQNGEQVVGRLTRLAIERHLSFFDNPDYYFDEQEAERILTIFSLFKHTSGDYYGKPFTLLPWQAFMLYVVFGWKVKATGKRLIRKLYNRVSKKNGKTELAAGLGIIGAFFDGEGVAEVYSAANKYDQACICWNAASTMVKFLREDSPAFNSMVKVYDSITTRAIINKNDSSFFKPIAADHRTLDGVRPHFAIIDEYHESKDTGIIDNLESGMVNRSQPLLAIITTAGFNINGPCHQFEKVVIDVMEGKKQDDTVFGLIFSLDEEDLEDWGNEKLWVKANPSIGVTPTWEGVRSQYQKAVNEGMAAEINFKTKNLNMWVRQAQAWLPTYIWKRNKGKFNVSDFYGAQCFGALDLAITRDLTAYALLFPPLDEKGKFHLHLKYYCPEENARERAKRDQVPYLDWAKSGHLTLTPGNVTDYRYIQNEIIKDCETFNVVSIGFDPFNAAQPATELAEQGVPMTEFRQNFSNFNEPVAHVEKILSAGRLNYNDCPVFFWMGGNVVTRRNPTGLLMFDKQKSKEKIDGMVAFAMAIGEYLNKGFAIEQDYNVIWM